MGIEIDLWLHAGFDVLVNGSRAHLPQARARYEAALLPVCLQVSPDVLRSQFAGTGGEISRWIDLRRACGPLCPVGCHVPQ